MSEHLNELIGYNVQGTAEWRLRKAEQFPDDTRNIRAAEELERLAREINGLNGSEVERQIDEGTIASFAKAGKTYGQSSMKTSPQSFVRSDSITATARPRNFLNGTAIY
jgi:hypothetical protein